MSIRYLAPFLLHRLISCGLASSEGRPLFTHGALTVLYPWLKNLYHVFHFLVVVLLFGDFDIGHSVGAWSKLARRFHVRQSVRLVQILNKLKRGTIKHAFDAGLFIEGVAGVQSDVLVVVDVHLILNIDV